MKPVSQKEATPPDDVRQTLTRHGLTLDKYARYLKAELGAMEVKAQIPKGEKDFSYSKKMKAWPIRQKARQDLGKHWGAESAEGGGGDIIVNIQKFGEDDGD